MPYRLAEAFKAKQQLLESASMDFKMGVGRLKGVYGKDEIPSHEQLVKDATLAAKIYKISDVSGFVKYVESQIKLKESINLTESFDAKKFMKEFNVQIALLKDSFKDADVNSDFKNRIETIAILCAKAVKSF